jgi:hypothetical protein
MRFILFVLFLLSVSCSNSERGNGRPSNLDVKSRFLRDNHSSVRILSIDDEGFERRVIVEGIETKERTFAKFTKDQDPKVGQVCEALPVTDGKVVWFRLRLVSPTID